ncbi:hypothetical protein JHU38_08275 [Prevotella sp. A2931]|uniref:TOTE conflict system primase domain-containing protein n=1 Tax=Prevotella illustrans TaxID=2800387 RepID=A0ABS3M6F4_9BACT|nr:MULTISPECIES: hypothetical protein [Prevotella]MBO1363762.1 hypothetical protein [Prevotella illustrans]PTL26248.1 hypothetical protein C3V39_03775 [Prevotella sp. oral taxon 820]
MINEEQYHQILQRCETLQKENDELKALLRVHGIEYTLKKDEAVDSLYSPIIFPSIRLTLDDKVKLFRSLFKGREDVYAKRWQSRTTWKDGYQPVCN